MKDNKTLAIATTEEKEEIEIVNAAMDKLGLVIAGSESSRQFIKGAVFGYKYARTQPDTELIKFVLEWVAENGEAKALRDDSHCIYEVVIDDEQIRAMLPAITEAWGKEKGNAPRQISK